MRKQIYFINAALALGAGAASAAEEASPPPSLEEVVVTAERRSTNLQTTGISASVLTGADLTNKGIMSVDGLQAIAPRSSSRTSARATISTSAASARASTTPRPPPA